MWHKYSVTNNKELNCGLDVVSRSDFSGKSVGVTLYCGNCRVECTLLYLIRVLLSEQARDNDIR